MEENNQEAEEVVSVAEVTESNYIQNDFVPDSELKTIMYQYNPLALKDIHNIEKGVENFFKFNQSHFALSKFENLTSLQEEDIRFLESKNILKTYEYVDFEKDSSILKLRRVILRPASLKAEQANKAIQSCIRGSAVALLQYIRARDLKIIELQEKNEIKDWVFKKFIMDQNGNMIDFNDRKNLPRILKNIINFSFEYEIEKKISLSDEHFASVIGLLSKKNLELYEAISGFSELPPDAQDALKTRSDLPILIRYTPDFHLIQPSFDEMVNMSGEKFREVSSEVDYIYFIFVEMAKKILISILPEESSGWVEKTSIQQTDKLYDELSKHKSFTQGNEWPKAEEFLFILKKLAGDYDKTKIMRNDTRLEFLVTENLKPLNMRYDVYNINLENIEIDSSVLKSYNNNKQEAFQVLVQKIKENRNIVYRKSKKENFELTRGLTVIFKENIPRAFIKNKGIRNLLNIMAKQNGYPAGIYDFLIPVTKEDPKELVDVQIALSKAIDEWISDMEKERIKKENASKSIIVRIIEFIFELFGFKSAPSVQSVPSPAGITNEEELPEINANKENAPKKSIGVIVGPKEKKILIPGKVQKAIEFVERNNKGLIWVDEVLHALGSPQYTAHEVGDMLFYDQNRRYMELRSLNNIRHIFISKDLENDEKWLKSTIDYLNNMTSDKKEYKILSQLLGMRLS